MEQRLLIAFLVAIVACGCVSSAQQTVGDPKVREKPARAKFQRSKVVIKGPTTYEFRETSKGRYDPKPRVVPIDESAGRYELRWIGYDGNEKVVQYQRHDALDAMVEARVERLDKAFNFVYRLTNFASSPAYLGSFKVQTFSSDIKDERVSAGENLHVGHMSKHIPQFSEGLWRAFAPLGEANHIRPGMTREFTISSSSPPGIVNCYARAGPASLQGVGEHMPYELEMSMPGYDELASCLTIGPVERLASLSHKDRIAYFAENLPKCVDAGWMTLETSALYERILNEKGFTVLLEKAKSDLQSGLIPSEVFHIIDGLAG